MEEDRKMDALDGFLLRAKTREGSKFLLRVYNSEYWSAGISDDGYSESLSCVIADVIDRVGQVLSLPNIDLYVEDMKDGSMHRIEFNHGLSSVLRAKVGIALRCPSYRLAVFTYKDYGVLLMSDLARYAKESFERMDADDYVIFREPDIQDLMGDIESSGIKMYRYNPNHVEYTLTMPERFGMSEREFLLGSLFPDGMKSKHREPSSGHEKKVSKEIGKRRKKNKNKKTHRRHK